MVDASPYIVEVTFPKRMASSAKYDEEEKRDKIVRLEDIMGDIYAMKFGKKGDAKTSLGKKRTY